MPSYYVLQQETKEGEKEVKPLVGMPALRKSLTSLMDRAARFDADMQKTLAALVSKATSDTKSARAKKAPEKKPTGKAAAKAK
eukprot:1851984-Amphidinium_carterae.1